MCDEADDNVRFFCDAMLGGLARWLRAAGYDARFEYGIDDGVLVRTSMEAGLILLSSDGRMFERNVIKHQQVRALYIPQQMGKLQQLRFVLDAFRLPLCDSRCMGCGGLLQEVPKNSVIGEAPPLAFRNCQRFWRCARCGKLLWQGTHWHKISQRLAELCSHDGRPRPSKDAASDQ